MTAVSPPKKRRKRHLCHLGTGKGKKSAKPSRTHRRTKRLPGIVILPFVSSNHALLVCSDPDGISARIIRECCEELTVPMTKICHMPLNQGVFPKQWKQANVVPLFKKGSVKDPLCHRSISLIPLFGKVLEKVAFMCLSKHVEPAISPSQHGFVSGRLCVTNLASLLGTVWDSIDENTQTDCIYTDFSSALQSVNHSLLIHILQNSYSTQVRL